MAYGAPVGIEVPGVAGAITDIDTVPHGKVAVIVEIQVASSILAFSSTPRITGVTWKTKSRAVVPEVVAENCHKANVLSQDRT